MILLAGPGGCHRRLPSYSPRSRAPPLQLITAGTIHLPTLASHPDYFGLEPRSRGTGRVRGTPRYARPRHPLRRAAGAAGPFHRDAVTSILDNECRAGAPRLFLSPRRGTSSHPSSGDRRLWPPRSLSACSIAMALVVPRLVLTHSKTLSRTGPRTSTARDGAHLSDK